MHAREKIIKHITAIANLQQNCLAECSKYAMKMHSIFMAFHQRLRIAIVFSALSFNVQHKTD